MANTSNRRRVLTVAGGIGVGTLAGCLGGGSDGSASLNVGLVLGVGGTGDEGFNDLAYEGAQRAESELDISFDMAQPDDETQFEQYQRRYAQSTDPDYDLICAIGYTQSSTLEDVSAEFPDQDFMIVDSVVEESNVASYTFREHEGAFLAGTVAGHLTGRDFDAGGGSTSSDDSAIGFVGGTDSYLINKFRSGYEAGARAVDEEIDVLASYVGSFSDPSTAKESAKGMYANGADVIYAAAGGSGVGVFQAAQEDGRFGFGSDTQKSVTQSEYADVILGSVIKKTDQAVYRAIESHLDDAFPAGENVALGLDEDGIDFAYGDEIGDAIPDEIATAIDENRQAIIDGEIDVPAER